MNMIILGLYEVCIKITYYGGCEAYKCKQVQVGEVVQCKADFERIPISTTNNPLQVAFRAIPSHINNKNPKEICWKFGDGKGHMYPIWRRLHRTLCCSSSLRSPRQL
jgi:hypothetical protein